MAKSNVAQAHTNTQQTKEPKTRQELEALMKQPSKLPVLVQQRIRYLVECYLSGELPLLQAA